MRIAVIGGLGFIGSSLTEKLVKRGYDVVVVDVREGRVPEGVELRAADVTNLDQMMKVLDDVDIVYHLAGTVLNVSRKNPHLAVRLDLLGTSNVLEASVKNSLKKVIYSSSFYAYDGLPADSPVDENLCSDIFKAEMFGVVKLVGERLILDYNRRHNLQYVVLRYGPVYGPGDRCTSVVSEFVKVGLCGGPLVVWGRGERKNQYTYVEDVAEGSAAALLFENEIFNLISPEQVTIHQVAELLAKKYGFKVEYDLSRPEGPSVPYISPKKAMRKLDWNPLSLEEGIEKTVNVLKTRV